VSNERFKKGVYYLSKSNTPRDVFLAWRYMENLTKDKSAIIALKDYERSAYPSGMISLVNSRESGFIPYFQSDKLYFVDDELLDEMFDNSSRDVNFRIDYSVMFDTNFSSYIHRFVNKSNWSSLSNEVFSSIDILIRKDFRFDYFFYLIENYSNAFLNEKNSPSTMQNIQADLYLNLVSLELFKNIDKNEYCKNGNIRYNITEQEAYILVDRIFGDFYNSSKGKEVLESFVLLHRSMVLFLIGVLKIRFKHKTSPDKKIVALFSYINNVVGAYLEREMIVAHKFYSNPRSVGILNKINKGMKKDKLYKSIENIAWDFTAPRIMEYFLELGGEGRYFIPFFLSYDKNLRELLRLYNVKGVIYNKNGSELTPFTEMNGIDYFQKHNCKFDYEAMFSIEGIEMRNEKAYYNKNTKFRVIEDEFEKLVEVMECT